MVPEEMEGESLRGGPAWKESRYPGEPTRTIVKLPRETPLTSAEAMGSYRTVPRRGHRRRRLPGAVGRKVERFP